MSNIRHSLAALALASAVCMPAAGKTAASDSLVNNYMRSSIYTILVNSNAQNARIDKETAENANKDAILGMVKAIANTDAKRAANETSASLASLPMAEFLNIEIPDQFNDHNLVDRIIDFDAIKATLTDADKKEFAQLKNQKAGNVAKSLAGGLLGGAAGKSESSMLRVDEVDELLPAVLGKYFRQKNTAAHLLAKWYDYENPAVPERKWDWNLITERGSYNFNEEDLKKAATDFNMQAKIGETGFNMINNTYVVALNLRFRSNQAVAAEAASLAKSVGGMFGGIGSLASSLAGTVGSAAAGDGFTVQAVSRLYKLKWNEDLNQKFYTDIYEKDASLDDLIASGICELEFIGQDKGSAGVRQSILSDKPMSALVKRATARAIDASIAKLQGKYEVFRTVMPIIGGDGQGIVYAAIGTKEGLNEKDEYEILEAQEDEKGKVTYKSVGVVKPVKGKIWENRYGAQEEAAENAANAKGKSKDFSDEAVNLGHSEFKGKKGDYTGYFLRLKKKK